MLRKGRIPVTDVNPHLLCVLCGGYFVDATTIIECLHSYCRTCIVRYLETSKMCPLCDVLVHKTKPLENLRADKTLQDLVYKLVPGLFESEMANRRKFYAEHPEEVEDATLEDRGDACMEKSEEDEEEQISLVLELSANGQPPRSPKAKITDTRYLLCPSGVTVGHLKKFINVKFSVPSKYQIQFYHSRVELSDNLSLYDIANLYTWRRTEPLRLFYMIYHSPPKTAVVTGKPDGRRRRLSECKARQERKLANLLDFTASDSPIKIGSSKSPKYYEDSDTDSIITDKCTIIRDVNENCVKRNNSDSDSSVDERPRIKRKDLLQLKRSGIFIKPRTPSNGKHKLSRISDYFVKPKLAKLDIYSKSSKKSKYSGSQLLNDTKIVDSMKLLKIDKNRVFKNCVKDEQKIDVFDFSDETSVRPKVVSMPKSVKDKKDKVLIMPGHDIKTCDVKPKLCTDSNDVKVEFNMHMPNNKLNDVILNLDITKTKCDFGKTSIVKQEESSLPLKFTQTCDSKKAVSSTSIDSNNTLDALINNMKDCVNESQNESTSIDSRNTTKRSKIWNPHLSDSVCEKKGSSSTVHPAFRNFDSETDKLFETHTKRIIETAREGAIQPIQTVHKASHKTPVPKHSQNTNGKNNNKSTSNAKHYQQKQIPTQSLHSVDISNTQKPNNTIKQRVRSSKQSEKLKRSKQTEISTTNKQPDTSSPKQTVRAKQKQAKASDPENLVSANQKDDKLSKLIAKTKERTQSMPFGGVSILTQVDPKLNSSSALKSHSLGPINTKPQHCRPSVLFDKHESASKHPGTTIAATKHASQTSPSLQVGSPTTSKKAFSPISVPKDILSSPIHYDKPEHQKRLDDEEAVMGLLELSKVTKVDPVKTPEKQTEIGWLNPKRNMLPQNKSPSTDKKLVEKKLDFKNWEYLKQKCSKIKTKSLSSNIVKDDAIKTIVESKTDKLKISSTRKDTGGTEKNNKPQSSRTVSANEKFEKLNAGSTISDNGNNQTPSNLCPAKINDRENIAGSKFRTSGSGNKNDAYDIKSCIVSTSDRRKLDATESMMHDRIKNNGETSNDVSDKSSNEIVTSVEEGGKSITKEDKLNDVKIAENKTNDDIKVLKIQTCYVKLAEAKDIDNTSDIKVLDTNSSDVKMVETKRSVVPVSDTNASNISIAEPKVSDVKLTEIKNYHVRMAETKTSDPNMTEIRASDVGVTETKTGDANVAETKTDDTKVTEIKTGDANVAETKTDDTQVTEIKTGDASVADTTTCDAKANETIGVKKKKNSTNVNYHKPGNQIESTKNIDSELKTDYKNSINEQCTIIEKLSTDSKDPKDNTIKNTAKLEVEIKSNVKEGNTIEVDKNAISSVRIEVNKKDFSGKIDGISNCSATSTQSPVDVNKRNGDIDNFSVRTKKQKAIDVIVKQINERNDMNAKIKNGISTNTNSDKKVIPTSPTSPINRSEKRGDVVMRTKKDEVRKIMNSYKESDINITPSPIILNTPNPSVGNDQNHKKRSADKCEMNIPKKRKLDNLIVCDIVNSEKNEGQSTLSVVAEKVNDHTTKTECATTNSKAKSCPGESDTSESKESALCRHNSLIFETGFNVDPEAFDMPTNKSTDLSNVSLKKEAVKKTVLSNK